jgi:hypothetical protein
VTAHSSAGEVARLIVDLESSDAIRRAAAVARLRVIGERALTRLAALMESEAPASARALALTALQDQRATRALDISLGALDDADAEVVVTALGVLRDWVVLEEGTRALEAVTAVAVDESRDSRVRAAAVEALSDLPEHLVRPLRERTPRPEGDWTSLDDPAAVRAWLDVHGSTAPPATLHALIGRVHAQEGRESAAPSRHEWRRARGLAHRVLARRGSRLALYDLRDAFDTTQEPLPEDFLMAAENLGDPSCLEPLGRAWSVAPHDPPWRARVSTTARTIARRARVTARSAAMKRIREQWPGFI